MGACILTFESINKNNPLTTNQTTAIIANVFGNVHAPICISCSHFDINEQYHESIQIVFQNYFQKNSDQCYIYSNLSIAWLK